MLNRELEFKLKENLEEFIKESARKGFKGEVKVSIYDIKTGLQVRVNGDIPGWAASIIKVPIMVTILEQIEARKLELGTKLEVDHKLTLEPDDYVSRLKPGVKLPVSALLHYMIVRSDNEATNMLASRVGVECINDTMSRLGMKKSMLGHLLCPGVPRYTSDFNPDGSNITCADDMTTLFRHLYDPAFSKLTENVRNLADLIMVPTRAVYINQGSYFKLLAKAKIGSIYNPEDGADIHETGIIEDRLIVTLMGNKLGKRKKRKVSISTETPRTENLVVQKQQPLRDLTTISPEDDYAEVREWHPANLTLRTQQPRIDLTTISPEDDYAEVREWCAPLEAMKILERFKEPKGPYSKSCFRLSLTPDFQEVYDGIMKRVSRAIPLT